MATLNYFKPTVYITRDGQRIAEVENNEFKILAWFHKNVGYSMDHATTHEGYGIVEVPERFGLYLAGKLVGEKLTMRAAKIWFTKMIHTPGEYEWRREQYTADLGWFGW